MVVIVSKDTVGSKARTVAKAIGVGALAAGVIWGIEKTEDRYTLNTIESNIRIQDLTGAKALYEDQKFDLTPKQRIETEKLLLDAEKGTARRRVAELIEYNRFEDARITMNQTLAFSSAERAELGNVIANGEQTFRKLQTEALRLEPLKKAYQMTDLSELQKVYQEFEKLDVYRPDELASLRGRMEELKPENRLASILSKTESQAPDLKEFIADCDCAPELRKEAYAKFLLLHAKKVDDLLNDHRVVDEERYTAELVNAIVEYRDTLQYGRKENLVPDLEMTLQDETFARLHRLRTENLVKKYNAEDSYFNRAMPSDKEIARGYTALGNASAIAVQVYRRIAMPKATDVEFKGFALSKVAESQPYSIDFLEYLRREPLTVQEIETLNQLSARLAETYSQKPVKSYLGKIREDMKIFTPHAEGKRVLGVKFETGALP